jgi:hypothetical protein
VAYSNGQTEVGMGMDMGILTPVFSSAAGGIVSLGSNSAVDIIIHCARLLESEMNRFNRDIQEKLWKVARRWRGLGDYPVINRALDLPATILQKQNKEEYIEYS